jgi:hypothetical protein
MRSPDRAWARASVHPGRCRLSPSNPQLTDTEVPLHAVDTFNSHQAKEGGTDTAS